MRDSPPMYCKNCGREIDADARFCPDCGYDQTRVGGSSYRSVDADRVYDSASVEAEKKEAMKLTLILSLLASLVLGVWGGVIVLVIMILYYNFSKKVDTDVVMGCILGGIAGTVVGYIINLVAISLLFSAMM